MRPIVSIVAFVLVLLQLLAQFNNVNAKRVGLACHDLKDDGKVELVEHSKVFDDKINTEEYKKSFGENKACDVFSVGKET